MRYQMAYDRGKLLVFTNSLCSCEHHPTHTSSQLQILHDKWCPTCRHFRQCLHLYCTYTPSSYECVSTVNAMLHWWQTEVEGKKWPASHVCFLSAIPCSAFWKKKCVNSDYKSIWNLNASTCKCNQMCTVCPSIIVFHYATREANQKKQDQGISSISIQFWYNSCIWLPMIRSIWSCRWDRRDCFPQIWKRHIPWKPPWLLTRELQDFGYHLTSSTSHSVMEDRILRLTCLTPRQLIWDLCSSRQSTDWREFFFLPSPILLSHPLHEGLLFQT